MGTHTITLCACHQNDHPISKILSLFNAFALLLSPVEEAAQTAMYMVQICGAEVNDKIRP